MMWSMWNAPSDRDYYGDDDDPFAEPDDPACPGCGARPDQACEEGCLGADPEDVAEYMGLNDYTNEDLERWFRGAA